MSYSFAYLVLILIYIHKDFNKTFSTTLPPIDIDQKFNLFNKTLSGSSNNQASITIDVEAKVDAQVTLGVVIAGSLVPRNITEFALFASEITSAFVPVSRC